MEGVRVPLPVALALTPTLMEGEREPREDQVGLGFTQAPPEGEVVCEAVLEVERLAAADTLPRARKYM